ncbi:MAG: Sec-independent protein translocase protein TatB [Hyphomicrobium sp.]
MFEISWSELLILGIVTLIFVGPKELPVFLRTLGRYAGALKRHASDFRAQFDAAMREAELETMQKEVESMQASVNAEVMRAKTSFADAAAPPTDAAAPPPKSAPPEAAVRDYELPMPPMPAVPRREP